MILYEWNDLATALSYFLDGLDVFRLWQRLDDIAWSYEWITRVYLAQGDRDQAAQTAEQFEQVARRLDPGRGRSYFSLWRGGHIGATEASLYLAQGNLAAASRWASGSGLTADDTPTYQDTHDHLIWARVRLAQGRADETLAVLPRLQQQAEAQGRGGDSVQAQALHALALHACGDVSQAMRTLQRALALAEPEGYVRTFVDEGFPMAALLSAFNDQPDAASLRPYIGKLLAAFPQREVEPVTTTASHTPPPQPLIEPLSGRELEVLQLMAAGLSNGEIAAKLSITVGTVKTHVNAIFGKLEAHNRTLAVARARALKLLED
jgi:LuxR family maltose regulon positive regulatory protein